jgi:molybdate transport system substrate-binding protein
VSSRPSRITLGLALALGLFASVARAEEVLVFAAASLTDALGEIAKAYEAKAGDRAVFSFGASSTLARQIAEGAPADLFVSADEAKVDQLERQGKLVAGTRRDLLSNRLVIVVATDHGADVTSAEDLATAKVRVLALAEPQTVPAGIYAKEYLRRIGLWSKLIDKVVPTENVRGALAAVESGNADAAVVYETDALVSSKVKVVYQVPKELAPRIVYVAAVTQGGAHPAAAKRLLEALARPEAIAVFRRFGFLLAGDAGTP